MDYTQAPPPQSPSATTPPIAAPTLVRGMSLWDAVFLIVGGIIGSGVFLSAADVAGAVTTPLLFVLAWIVGMVVTALACFSFAELAALFPEAGGQYVYIREAYGEFPAFLYGWMIFSVNATGGVAAIAAGFAAYTGAIIPALNAAHPLLNVFGFTLNLGHVIAITAIAFLTFINVVGLRPATILQNLASWTKFIAIAAFLLFGFTLGHGHWSNFTAPPTAHLSPRALLSGFAIAMIAVFWVYDGWVYITWVSGEVKDPGRNIPRALIISVALVGAIIVGMNALYLFAMPLNALADSRTVAETAAQRLFFPAAGRWLGALVAISCFGAAAAAVTSGARVYYAMARDGVFFHRLAEVHPRWRTPAFSLIVQGIWSSILVLIGRYDQIFTYVMFLGVISYGIATSAIFVFRRKYPDRPRAYKCPGYPWVPLLYCLICLAWALNTLWERPLESLAGIGIMLIAAPAYFYWKRTAK
jgi:basic amino acid/polyamine antiporter, APA family